MIPLLISLLPIGNTGDLAPHGFGVENTYTITSVMELLEPADPAVMTDAYQDAVLIGRSGGVAKVSVTYFPMNDAVRQKRLNMYASKATDLHRYLASTTTCNWDAQTRKTLLLGLAKAGIVPPPTPTVEYVQKVADWAMNNSRFDGDPNAMPVDWYVSFRNHKPWVDPRLRHDFEAAKGKDVSDASAFGHQLFGNQMIANACHGACTSSSVYLATVFRALGVPTRILYFVPPCDGNDATQLSMLRKAITNHVINDIVLSGVAGATGFANHMFNEVWVEGRWRRLNYNRLDQEVADRNYLGLLTHISTCADIEESHLAESWATRSAEWPNVASRLSSVNPYRLIAVSDHWGKNAKKDNPEVASLKTGTVIKVAWRDTPDFKAMLFGNPAPENVDLFIFTKEWLPTRNYIQMREFIQGASHTFELRAPGQPPVRVEYAGLNVNTSDERCYGFRVALDDRVKLRQGISYGMTPIQAGSLNRWVVPPDIEVRVP